jgi:hypothetical protein
MSEPVLSARFHSAALPVHLGGPPVAYAPQLVPLRDLFTIAVNSADMAAVVFTVTPTATLLALLAEGLSIPAILAGLSVFVDYDDGGVRKWAPFTLTVAGSPLNFTQGGACDPLDLTAYGFNGPRSLAFNAQFGFVWRKQPAEFIGGDGVSIEYEMRDTNSAGALRVTNSGAMGNGWDSNVFWYGNSGTGPLGGFMVGMAIGDDENGLHLFSAANLYLRQRFTNPAGQTAWLETTLPLANCAPAPLTI